MDESKIRLGIALPLTDDKCYTQFLDSFIQIQKPAFIYIRPVVASLKIDDIRNQLVEQALKNNCTHLLMMDTDQIYNNTDTIYKLLSHDLPVVSAIAHRRYPPFDHLMYRGKIGKYKLVEDSEIEQCRKDNSLLEIDATGCGCVLYNTDVFRKIDPPWFELSETEEGNPVGEDIGFCNKLKEAGYKIYCDPTINIGHLSLLEVNWGTYLLYKKLKGLQEKHKEE